MKNARLLSKGASVFIIVFTVILCSIPVSKLNAQAPVANFSANVVSGCSPLVVQFTDQSTGNPTSWHWDLGNGSTATIQNPTATYVSPGTYTITLTATNSSGSNTNTKTSYITVFAAPVAKFTSTDTTGCTPLGVNFTDQSSSSNGTITQWEWNFGDGGTSNVQNPSHTYTMSGTFNVYLKVTSSSGCSETIFKQQYIRAGAGAIADFVANVPNSCQVPVTVSFANSSQTDGAVTYLWDFGDGSTSTAENPNHTYTAFGSYTITLTVQSPDGCNSIKQKSITLSGKNVDINGPSSICIGSVANFSMSTSSAPLSQTWQMGDGTNYYTSSVSHSYGATTSYTVTLLTQFTGGCVTTTTKSINVQGGPVLTFSADTTKACKPPFIVNFKTTSPASSYTWDFGDGITSNQQNPTHTYQSAGEFNVKLSATNAIGCASEMQKDAYIKINPPSVSITNLPINDGCTPYSFTPIADIKATEGVASYFWDFGNGYTSTSDSASYTYTTPGTYTIKLKIVTKGGCSDSIEYPNAVKISPGTNLDFTANPLMPCVDKPVSFNMITSASPYAYTWYFGDHDSSTLIAPTHAYSSIGKFNITLMIKYGNCTSRLSKDRYIDVQPPEARFSAVRDCINKRLINFKNQSKGTGSLVWDFGDGSTSTAVDPTHIYSTDGNYDVILTIDNGTCSHSLKKTIEVSSTSIDIAASKTIVCKNELFTLKAIIPNTVSATEYAWDVTGSGHWVTTVDSSDWSLNNTGPSTVILKIITDNGCTDSVTKADYITVYGPTADFISDKPGGCINSNINFTDSSSSDGIHPITQWVWDFGNSQNASGISSSHMYDSTGRYDVTLKVTDTYGCSDSLIKKGFILITNGKAMFTSLDSMSCRGKNVVFKDTSVGTISFWDWDFGDGQTSNGIQSPAHIYADSGIYTVKLRIIENSGCADSVTKVNYVTIKDPRAKFGLSDTFSTCPPLTVHFYDSSYYVKKWSWDFGDGGSAPIASPINLYNIPNNYRVKLKVTSPGGCTDSAFANIRILGPYGQFDYTPLIGCTPFPVTYNVSSATAVKYMWDYSDGIVDSGTVANSSHTYNSGGIFVPKVILTDAAGCRVPVIGKDTIYIEKTNLDFIASAVSFCDTGTVVFTNKSIVDAASANYEWSFGDGQTSSAHDPTHSYTSPSWYDVTLKATTPLGCVDTLTKQAYIRVNNSPVAAIISPDSLCKPASFTFTPQLQPDTSGIKTWSWTFGNGKTSNQKNPSSQSFASEGSYSNTLFVEDEQGCSTTVAKTVVVHPLPKIVLSDDAIICRGDSTQLTVSGAVSYSWLSPNNGLSCSNCPNPVASPLLSTMYKVEGRSSFGCASYDSVFVNVFQPYKITVDPPADSICQGKGVILKAFGAPLYSWSPAAGLSSTTIANPFAAPQETTTYRVTGYDSLGCFRDSTEVSIKVYPIPTVNAGPDIIVSSGSSATIQTMASSDVIKYSWSPATALSSPSVLNPSVIGGEEINYTIKVTNAAGCTAQDQVKVLATCTEANIFVPNTFTPNGDGMNDVFYIRGKGIFVVKSLKIFNRWGELVFEKKDVTPNDPDSGWNGMYKGAFASTDTYIYQLEVLCNNRQELKYNGTISLIR